MFIHVFIHNNTCCIHHNRIRGGVKLATQVRKRGRPPQFPAELEENLIKLAKACDARSDRSAGPRLVLSAVGEYIRGSVYEKSYRESYSGRWQEEEGVILPGKTWLKNFERRIKQNPRHKRTKKCRGRDTDISKLR